MPDRIDNTCISYALEPAMSDELQDLIEHLERYRATTLQVLDLVGEGDLDWRPRQDQYKLGQHLLHIAQTEDHFSRGLFRGDWDSERIRFPERLPGIEALKKYFAEIREFTLGELRELDPKRLGKIIEIPNGPPEHSLRSWLWFILEHKLHHRGQIWAYLRAMGFTPPFYAIPLPLGERPDVRAREELGGF